MTEGTKTRKTRTAKSVKRAAPRFAEKTPQAAQDASEAVGACDTRGERAKSGRGLLVAVCTIAKDEEAFAERWMRSMGEADGVFVLDTGSSDGTIEALSGLGAKVGRSGAERFRFDAARNEALSLVPEGFDIVVSTDLDEVFSPGWCGRLKEAWEAAESAGKPVNAARCELVWNFNEDGSDGVKYRFERIHRRGAARWVHACHEVLDFPGGRHVIDLVGVRIEHHPDNGKSREQYLALLEEDVRENPMDDRAAHYLGREYMYRGMWDQAIAELTRHLSLPTATWTAERAASMRFIAKCMMEGRNDYEGARAVLMKAMDEDPAQRDAAMELAEYADKRRDWATEEMACRRALAVTERDLGYISDPRAWGSRPHDLLGVACWYLGKKEEAVREARKALEMSPDVERIRTNVRLMEAEL